MKQSGPFFYHLLFSTALLLITGALDCVLADDSLTPYEQNFSLPVNPGDSLEQRLSRMENLIFGEAQAGDAGLRQQRLLQVLQGTRSTNTNTAPPNYGGEMNDSGSFQSFGQNFNPAPPRRPDATDYPSVTAMERKVFGRDFIRDDITQRLDRLERKTFNTTYPKAALIDRVDKLTLRIPGMVIPKTGSPLDQMPASSSEFTGSSMDTYLKLDALEKYHFSGKTYSGKLITERLDQLEKRLYGNTSSGESVDTRLNRLLSSSTNNASYPVTRQPYQPVQPYQPAPSPGYGTYSGSTTYSTTTPYSGSSTSTRQNIQIGSGFSSQSNQQYSPEFLGMLPPGIRSQVQNGATSSYQSSSSGGFVASGPGTVILQEQSEYPGFYNYSGKPMQFRNYYAPPGAYTPAPPSSGYTTTQTFPGSVTSGLGVPTGIPYNPGTTTYTYTQPLDAYGNPLPNTAYYGTPPGYANPYSTGFVYTGDPAVLQALNNLELNAYGKVNTQMAVPSRISQLEASLLGQTLDGMGYSDQDRISNLQKTTQYQSLGKMLGKGKLRKLGRAAGSMWLGVPLNAPATVTPPATTTPVQ